MVILGGGGGRIRFKAFFVVVTIICERRGIYDWGRIYNVNTAVTFIAEQQCGSGSSFLTTINVRGACRKPKLDPICNFLEIGDSQHGESL